jgi:zona occludens toxin (predicted ATPase)
LSEKMSTLGGYKKRVSIYIWGNLCLVYHLWDNQNLDQWKDNLLKHDREGRKREWDHHQWPICLENNHIVVVEKKIKKKKVTLSIEMKRLVAEDTAGLWQTFQIVWETFGDVWFLSFLYLL